MPPIETPAATETLLDTKEIARRLDKGEVHVERLVAQGMPFVDVGIHDRSKPRQRRTLRFIWSDCLRWLQVRNERS